MFVKRSKNFDARCTMMNLMKKKPAKAALVAQHMPPIKHKCSNKPRSHSLNNRWQLSKGKDRAIRENGVIHLPTHKREPKLTKIDEYRTSIPTSRMRKLSARHKSFQNHCADRDGKNDVKILHFLPQRIKHRTRIRLQHLQQAPRRAFGFPATIFPMANRVHARAN